jgi:gas vesicle protein
MFKLRFTYLAIALGLATAAACNKDKTRDNAESAAEAVQDKTEDLKDESKDLAETAKDKAEDLRDESKDLAEDVKDESKAMMKEGIAARDAQKEFEYQRLVRIQTLRAVHGIASSQPMLINAIAQSQPLVAADRAKINEKVLLIQMRLDESANLIQALEGVDAANWVDRERVVADAMGRLEDARSDAWEALDEAKHIDQTSMR